MYSNYASPVLSDQTNVHTTRLTTVKTQRIGLVVKRAILIGSKQNVAYLRQHLKTRRHRHIDLGEINRNIGGYSMHTAGGKIPPEILNSQPRKSGSVNFQLGLEI